MKQPDLRRPGQRMLWMPLDEQLQRIGRQLSLAGAVVALGHLEEHAPRGVGPEVLG